MLTAQDDAVFRGELAARLLPQQVVFVQLVDQLLYVEDMAM